MKYNPVVVTAYFREMKLPPVVFEYQIDPDQNYRWDLAFLMDRLAIEVQGGTWTGGAHTRGWGVARDMKKHNIATCAGWRVLYVEPAQLERLATVAMIRMCIGGGK